MASVYQLPLFPLEKRCSRCCLLKSISEFAFYHNHGHILAVPRPKCIACEREYNRETFPNRTRAKKRKARREAIASASEKRCSRCGCVKPRSAFGARPERLSGMQSWCLACRAEHLRLKNAGRPREPKRSAKRALWAQGLQTCLKCGALKPLEDFYRDSRRVQGRLSRCKACVQVRERQADRKSSRRQWARRNREKVNADKRIWWKANPKARLAKQRKRHLIQRRAVGTYRPEDVLLILVAQEGCCAYCGCAVDVDAPRFAPHKATVDHIVPLTRGGTNWPDNLAVACPACNTSKGNRLLSEWTDRPGSRCAILPDVTKKGGRR